MVADKGSEAIAYAAAGTQKENYMGVPAKIKSRSYAACKYRVSGRKGRILRHLGRNDSPGIMK